MKMHFETMSSIHTEAEKMLVVFRVLSCFCVTHPAAAKYIRYNAART